MRCTSCSEVVKPVVAIDIDGTLGDYHGHFLRFADIYIGQNRRALTCYQGQCGFREWFLDVYGVDERTWYDIKLAYRQGAQKRSMPKYAFAAEMCRQIRDAGAELWLTTTRPYLRLDNVDPDTRAWLDRQAITYDRMLYDERKYPLLAALVDPARVVAVLDDEEEQYSQAAAAFGAKVPILRVQKYNGHVAKKRLHQATDLQEASMIIRKRINHWEMENR